VKTKVLEEKFVAVLLFLSRIWHGRNRHRNPLSSMRGWSCCAVQLPPSKVAKPAWPRWREVA